MVDLPPPTPLLAVEGLLFADSASTIFRIVHAPAGGEITHALPPAAVALELVAAAGTRAALIPVPGRPTHFRASLPIHRGVRYVLAGLVAGQPIRAETLVPGRFDVIAPADTVVAPGDDVPRLPFRWSASGAGAFYALGARLGPFGIATRDTIGQLFLDTPASRADWTTLTLVAITAEAEAYLFDPTRPRGNVAGAFGYVGGAIATGRTVRWP